jgi:hypothetical protein
LICHSISERDVFSLFSFSSVENIPTFSDETPVSMEKLYTHSTRIKKQRAIRKKYLRFMLGKIIKKREYTKKSKNKNVFY